MHNIKTRPLKPFCKALTPGFDGEGHSQIHNLDLTISWDTCQGASAFPDEPGGPKERILQGAPVYTPAQLFLLLPSFIPRPMMAEARMESNPGRMDVSKENEQPTREAFGTNLLEGKFSESRCS
jgi:hypothetical protein